jgi:hypothetical protein
MQVPVQRPGFVVQVAVPASTDAGLAASAAQARRVLAMEGMVDVGRFGL